MSKINTKLQPDSVVTAGNMKMPVVGLGTWQATDEEVDRALRAAVAAGYRHIDTAFVYGNEGAIGKSVQGMIERGEVKREQLFIVTKLPHIANRAEYVSQYLRKSLEALRVDYLDLYLIHNPVGLVHRDGTDFFPKKDNGQVDLDLEVDHIQLWKAMEAEVDAGRTRAIGVSNFSLEQLRRIVDNCRLPPANLQVEMHVYLQQKELVAFCRETGVSVCGYAPLGSPALPKFTQNMGIDISKMKTLSPLTDPVVTEIAEKYGKLPAQVLLRFLMECGVAVIPKSTNPDRIRHNFDVFDLELSQEDFDRLAALDRGEEGRMFSAQFGVFQLMKDHPEFPFPK